MARTLYDKIWDEHVVHTEEDGTAVLYIDRHLVHEVTSPQAFEGLRQAGRKVWRVSSIVATADHNTPTTGWELGYDGITDPISKEQITTLDSNIAEFGSAAFFPFMSKRQGIVHVIGPENGATLPGMTVVCGDSHTSTHGAFGQKSQEHAYQGRRHGSQGYHRKRHCFGHHWQNWNSRRYWLHH
jgi:3-isopropylmalate/(R)-2-methylmalate dehydratase large subunit